jgi:hypothetical protein
VEAQANKGDSNTNKLKEGQTNTDRAFATILSEKPGSRTGGGHAWHSCGPCRPVGECWNCGGKGHQQDACSSPKKDDKEKNESAKRDDEGKGKHTSPSNSTQPSLSSGSSSSLSKPSNPPPYSKQALANTATNISGAWTALAHADIDSLLLSDKVTYEAANDLEEAEDSNEDTDILESARQTQTLVGIQAYLLSIRWSPEDVSHVSPFPIPDLPLRGAPNFAEVRIPTAAHAMAAETRGSAHPIWDLYDSGASHHMSPCREDFVSFKDIAPCPLNATNQEAFMAHGIGDLIVAVPNGDEMTQWCLQGTLYMPVLSFTLISVGRVDAGFFCNFGDGHCEITKWTGEVVGCIPKTGGLYRTPHTPPATNAALKLPRMSL